MAALLERSTDDRHRQLFEQNLAVQLVVDPVDGRIVDANQAAADFHGLTRSELARRRVTDFAALPDDAILQTLEVAAQVGAHSYAFPHRGAHAELRLVEIYAGPLTIGGHTFVHLILHDVTERVRAEEAARDLHAEYIAEQRTAALREELRRKEHLSRIGELVAGVAHEVRNPLFALSSTLDAMRARVGAHPDFDRYYPVMASQVERLSALMRDLLDYGRGSALTLGDFPPDAVVRAALEVTRPLAESRGVEVSVTVEDLLPPVRADWQRVVQAVQNVLANAVQHSAVGGRVEIVVARATLGDRDAIEFRIDDEGAGIAPDDLAKIFEPFFSRRPGGTGMGLAIAQRVAHDHGGTLDARNREGRGATLRARLPASPTTHQ